MKVGGTYQPGEGRIKQVQGFISQKDERAAVRKQNYQDSVTWYDGITTEIFG